MRARRVRIGSNITCTAGLSKEVLSGNIIGICNRRMACFSYKCTMKYPGLASVSMARTTSLVRLCMGAGTLASLSIDGGAGLAGLYYGNGPVGGLGLADGARLAHLRTFSVSLVRKISLLRYGGLACLDLGGGGVNRMSVSTYARLASVCVLGYKLFALSMDGGAGLGGVEVIGGRLRALSMATYARLRCLFYGNGGLARLGINGISGALGYSGGFLAPTALPAGGAKACACTPRGTLTVPAHVSMRRIISFSTVGKMGNIARRMRATAFA